MRSKYLEKSSFKCCHCCRRYIGNNSERQRAIKRIHRPMCWCKCSSRMQSESKIKGPSCANDAWERSYKDYAGNRWWRKRRKHDHCRTYWYWNIRFRRSLSSESIWLLDWPVQIPQKPAILPWKGIVSQERIFDQLHVLQEHLWGHANLDVWLAFYFLRYTNFHKRSVSALQRCIYLRTHYLVFDLWLGA